MHAPKLYDVKLRVGHRTDGNRDMVQIDVDCLRMTIAVLRHGSVVVKTYSGEPLQVEFEIDEVHYMNSLWTLRQKFEAPDDSYHSVWTPKKVFAL